MADYVIGSPALFNQDTQFFKDVYIYGTLYYDFNKFADPYGENQLKIKDGVYQLNNYMAKRLFTIDYKLKYKIYPFLINEVKKNIKANDF